MPCYATLRCAALRYAVVTGMGQYCAKREDDVDDVDNISQLLEFGCMQFLLRDTECKLHTTDSVRSSALPAGATPIPSSCPLPPLCSPTPPS